MNNPQLEISFLNINGLSKEKLKSDSFIQEILKPFSINCMVETFTNKDSKISVANFKHFHSYQTKELKSSKRSSGGILCYFRQKFNAAIDLIKSKHDDLLWIKLKKEYFTIDRDIYLGIVYIIPDNSTSLQHRTDSFETLKSEIDDFSKKGDIIIGGDFHCRVGLLPDYVEEDNNFYGNGDPEQIIDNQFANIYSQDKTINSLGRNLIDLCLTRQLKIINGRTLGDLTGNFTCIKRNGNSVVDYIICSESLLHKVIAFKIKHITNFSDHCQLSLTLDIKAKNNKKEIALKSKNLQKGKPKYIWNEDSKHKLLKFFHGNLLKKNGNHCKTNNTC